MKLKNKFYLLFFFSTLLVLGTVQITNFYREKKALYAKLEERGRSLSQTLSLASLNSFVTNSFSDLNFFMSELAKDEDVEYVVITDPQGKVILHTDPSKISQVLYDPVSVRAVRSEETISQIYTLNNHRIFEVSSPVRFASVNWGIVRIGFNLDALQQGFQKTTQFFFLLTLAVITAVSLIFLFIGDKITYPIEQLIQASQSLSRGNFSVRIPVKSKDEVGRLSQTFNQMAETLRKEREKLEQEQKNSWLYNKKLTKKIQDLSTLNKATKALRSSLSPEKKLNLILSISMIISQAEKGVFFSFFDKENLSPKVKKGSPINLEFFSQLARRAKDLSKPVAIMNGKEIEVDLRLPPSKEHNFITTLAYPLIARNMVWGVVVLDLPEKNFTFDELQMVSTFLEEVNLIIENSFLIDRILESRQMDSFNRLTSIILHDLRGTVAKLSLSLHNARKFYYDSQFREDFLTTISATVKKMRSLTEKISERPASLELKPYSINQILTEIVDELELRKLTHIKVKEHYGDIPLLMLDTSSIKRVFRNIVVNALEAMPEGGELEIKSFARMSDPYVFVEIKDSGEGMTQDFINERLFKPFVSTKKRGLGLALYSAREIVYLHGGEIEVNSKLGEGSIFRVKLPFFPQNTGKGIIRKRLGQYLLDMGVIGEEKLKEAMQVQATDKRRIGKILIDMGYIRKSEIERALEKQKEAEKKILEMLMREHYETYHFDS